MNDKCHRPKLNDLLPLFMERNLSPQQVDEVSEHITICAVCTQELQQIEEAHRSLAENRSIFEKTADSLDCISPELLVAYADQSKPLVVSDRQIIEGHIKDCPDCNAILEKIMTLNRSVAPSCKPSLGEDRFLEMVSRHIPLHQTRRRGLLIRLWTSLVLRVTFLIERLICAVNPSYQPVYVRGKKRNVRENVMVIQDGSAHINVLIEIEDIDGSIAEIAALITIPPLNKPLQDVRASLYSQGTETVSLYITDGRVVFSEVPHGQYALVIKKDKHTIKTINFSTVA